MEHVHHGHHLGFVFIVGMKSSNVMSELINGIWISRRVVEDRKVIVVVVIVGLEEMGAVIINRLRLA